MPDTAMHKLVKGSVLSGSRLIRAFKVFPCWDEPYELVHCGTDCVSFVLILSEQVSVKFLRQAGRSAPAEAREAGSQWRQRWHCRRLEQSP